MDLPPLEGRILEILERAPRVPRSPAVIAWALEREGYPAAKPDVVRALRRLRVRGYTTCQQARVDDRASWLIRAR